MILLGLTGSVAMGKSFVARVASEMGVPVLDSDAVVHELYAPGGAAVSPVRAMFGPGVVAEDGGVSRPALGPLVLGDADEAKANMAALETLVHALVDERRRAFLDECAASGHALVILDVPLLYEKGYESTVDAVAVASAGDAETQRRRALARPGMTPEKFAHVAARQMPDEEKRRRADFIIETGCAEAETEAAVRKLVEKLRGADGGGVEALAYERGKREREAKGAPG